MIFSTYHVFGSGSAGVSRFVRDPSITAAEYLRRCETLKKMATDDGHNGFVGTYSVPDEAAEFHGVRCVMWADPGPPQQLTLDGFLRVEWGLQQVRYACEAGFGELPVNHAVEAWVQAGGVRLNERMFA